MGNTAECLRVQNYIQNSQGTGKCRHAEQVASATDEEDNKDQVLMLDVMKDPPITIAQVRQWTTIDDRLFQIQLWCLKDGKGG